MEWEDTASHSVNVWNTNRTDGHSAFAGLQSEQNVENYFCDLQGSSELSAAHVYYQTACSDDIYREKIL